MTPRAAPMILIATREPTLSERTERWFRLTDYATGAALYTAIEAWLRGLGRSATVDEGTVRFTRYRNMPSFGPAPRRAWTEEYVDALRAGADPDALMSYVEIGGSAVDFASVYVGWFETRDELALHRLRERQLGATLKELGPFLDLAAYGQHLLATDFVEVHGHVFHREPREPA